MQDLFQEVEIGSGRLEEIATNRGNSLLKTALSAPLLPRF
jgi:hypothetical protein